MMLQAPGDTKVSVPLVVMVQTPGVAEVNDMGKPDVELAVSVGVVPKLFAPGFANVIVCGPCGVTLPEVVEAEPVPMEFVAVTVKIYGVPFVRPVTVIEGPLPLTVIFPGELVTVYPVMGAPPVKVGGVTVTVARLSPAIAETDAGAPGTTAFTVKLC